MPAQVYSAADTSLPRDIRAAPPPGKRDATPWGNPLPVQPVAPDRLRRPRDLGLSAPVRSPFKLGARGVPDRLCVEPDNVYIPPRPEPVAPNAPPPRWEALIEQYGGDRYTRGGFQPLGDAPVERPPRGTAPGRSFSPRVNADRVIANLMPKPQMPEVLKRRALAPDLRDIVYPTAEQLLSDPTRGPAPHERLMLIGGRSREADAIQRGIEAGWVHGWDVKARPATTYEPQAHRAASPREVRDDMYRSVAPIVNDLEEYSKYLTTSVKGSLCQVVFPDGEGSAAVNTRRRLSITSVDALGPCAVLSPTDPTRHRDGVGDAVDEWTREEGAAAAFEGGGWFDYMQLSHLRVAYFSPDDGGVLVLATGTPPSAREWRLRISRTSAEKWLDAIHHHCHWLRPGGTGVPLPDALLNPALPPNVVEVAPGVLSTTPRRPDQLPHVERPPAERPARDDPRFAPRAW